MFAASFFTLGLATFASAVPMRRSGPAQVITKCTVPNTTALTFDDGPYQYLQSISDQLSAAGAVGTFFFNGNNYDCIYNSESVKRAQYAFGKGHQIGSHTWRHAHLPELSYDELQSEFYRTEDALNKILGIVPAFTRPPYGEYNDLVRQVAGERGQTLVNWDFDSGDSVGKTAAQSNQLYDNVAQRHPSTLLALNHEVYQTTAEIVVPHAIETLQGAGYRLVSVAECLGMEPYKQRGSPSVRDSSWKC
ncbi:hypothetical protein H0H87_011990 [Tephrocybe sp. NHM501043]|nr:hypothetical protein H0H87_011990 [Tephrocybe sp. NHM501043]